MLSVDPEMLQQSAFANVHTRLMLRQQIGTTQTPMLLSRH